MLGASDECGQAKEKMTRPRTFLVMLAALVSALMVSETLPSETLPAGAQEDITPPDLVEFSFTPATIDTSAGDATVTVTARIGDSPAGFVSGSLEFRPATTTQSRRRFFSSSDRISGTPNDGVYQFTVIFPRFSVAGTWTVTSLFLEGAVRNSQTLLTAALTAKGFPTQLTNNAAVQDLTAPDLAEFSFSPSTIDTSAADATVTVTARIVDGQSGFSSTFLQFRSPTTQSRFAFLGSGNRISGTANDGVYRTTVAFPRFSASGTWTAGFSSLTDTLGNSRALSKADLAAAGFSTDLTNAATTEDL